MNPDNKPPATLDKPAKPAKPTKKKPATEAKAKTKTLVTTSLDTKNLIKKVFYDDEEEDSFQLDDEDDLEDNDYESDDVNEMDKDDEELDVDESL